MSVGRGGAGAVEIDGKIYVVGGMGSDGASLDSIEVFDIASSSWTNAPAMQVRRDNPGVAAFSGKVYVSVVEREIVMVQPLMELSRQWNTLILSR